MLSIEQKQMLRNCLQETTLFKIPKREDLGVGYYNGCKPVQLHYNLITRYCKTTSKILDPFAGSCVLQKLCNELDLSCVSYDINSFNDLSMKIDSIKTSWGIDLYDYVFLDPPYYKIWKYGNADYITKSSLDDYKKYIDIMCKHSFDCLNIGGIVVIAMCPTHLYSGDFVDTTLLFYDSFKLKFDYVDRFAVELYPSSAGFRNQMEGRLVKGFYDILIFKKRVF